MCRHKGILDERDKSLNIVVDKRQHYIRSINH